jgi:glycosyltransferase involved in cell wall biosynthesis
MTSNHKFTVIMDTYYRPHMLKQAVDAIRRQTYKNLEIILVNNGATPETIEFLHEADASDSRVRLLHFEENQFSWDDPCMMSDTCLNPALAMATGDYVWYQADDDLIADDYAEKMVALFTEDPQCTTAAGLPMALDADGNPQDNGPRISNFRPRHMPGKELVLKSIRGDRSIFSAPGTILTIRRDALIAGGGYHRNIEQSQFFGIVPFGVTGFDETAHFYWRRHPGQLNRAMSNRGLVGTKEMFALLGDWDIEGRWQVFGPEIAREVTTHIRLRTCRSAASWFVRLIYSGRPRSAFRVLSTAWRNRQFWVSVPQNLTQIKWSFIAAREGLKYLFKPVFRTLFIRLPGLARLSPKLEALRQRTIR